MLFYIVWDILRGTVTITSSIMKGLDICLKTFSTYNTYTSKNPFQFKIIIVICIYVLFIYRFRKATINRHILPNSAQYIYLLIFINNRVKIIWIARGLICIYILFSVYYLGFLFNIFKLTSLYFSFLPCFSLSFPPRVFSHPSYPIEIPPLFCLHSLSSLWQMSVSSAIRDILKLIDCSSLRSIPITETSSLLWTRLTSHSSLLVG